MDPVTAVGLASAIISFVPLGIKILQHVQEMKDSIDGSVAHNEVREAVVQEMLTVTAKLKRNRERGQVAPEYEKLYDLASRCEVLSQKVLALLEKVKPKTSTTSAKYYSAYKVWRKESEIKDLEKSLSSCREQLVLGLLDLMNQDAAAYSAKILAAIKDDSNKLEELQNHIEHLNAAVTDGETQHKLKQLLYLHEQTLQKIYQHRILDLLKFDGLHEREDRVHNPHSQTFEWIFADIPNMSTSSHHSTEDEDDAYSDEPAYQDRDSKFKFDDLQRHRMMTESRKAFGDWLSSSNGIFHITGKLGSGKSTLMRFLYMHPCTEAKLTEWAGEKKLVLAQFFFWKPGTDLQKSISGLYRSILYDILAACPGLIQQVFPIIWDRVRQTPWQIRGGFRLSAVEIKDGFDKLTNQALNGRLFESHRFCFFIDGLDEHEETFSVQDNIHLVQLLNSWANNSNGNLKLCVSSRDYNVFLNGFSDKQRLRLPDLTLFDMQKYVRDSLSHIPSRKLRTHFANEIPSRANGIFLWAVLVTADIRRQIENEVPEERLFKIVNSLPSSLQTLFHYILNSLADYDRKRTYQLMRLLMLRSAGDGGPISLNHFSLLDQYNEDNEFSTRGHFLAERFITEFSKTSDMLHPSDPALEIKRLRGCSGGLVECDETRYTIDFSHRSIPDMLRTREIKEDMDHALAGFDVIEAFSHLTFALAKIADSLGILNKGQLDAGVELCAAVASVRLKNLLDSPPYHFLEAMESLVDFSIHEPRGNREILICCKESTYVMVGFSDTHKPSEVPNRGDKTCFLYSTLYLAAENSRFDYVRWKIENFPSVVDTTFKRNILVSLIIGPPFRSRPSFEDIDYFFNNGILNEQCYNNISVLQDLDDVRCITQDHTAWQRYLAGSFLLWCGFDACVGCFSPEGFDTDQFSHIVLRFLENGAPVDFLVEIDNKDKELDQIVFHFENIQEVEFTQDLVLRSKLKHKEIWFELDGQKELTLRTWLEAMDLKNKSILIDLINRKEAEESR
ncbi:hypothetical protein Forpe1208_v015750 [Fusarium oxysporum f. sp. rapae]|uniref:Nephrocystin 3-like N-terminal domain-containing protein n=1 Tax=Fusarium oxysporum f. sp. rapae TaxID=485398 RepID=A0A8J5NH09_FUSOX|nr:hypothetical protein Forpe1208_v015750 [Fusarium oxysporum f. sp. rapae]